MDGITSEMQEYINDKDMDYWSVEPEYFIDPLITLEVKNDSKNDSSLIQKGKFSANRKSASHKDYYENDIILARFPHKKQKASTRKKPSSDAAVKRLGTAQDVHVFYTCSHLSALQSCALIFSIYFQLIFTFK